MGAPSCLSRTLRRTSLVLLGALLLCAPAHGYSEHPATLEHSRDSFPRSVLVGGYYEAAATPGDPGPHYVEFEAVGVHGDIASCSPIAVQVPCTATVPTSEILLYCEVREHNIEAFGAHTFCWG